MEKDDLWLLEASSQILTAQLELLAESLVHASFAVLELADSLQSAEVEAEDPTAAPQ